MQVLFSTKTVSNRMGCPAVRFLYPTSSNRMYQPAQKKMRLTGALLGTWDVDLHGSLAEDFNFSIDPTNQR